MERLTENTLLKFNPNTLEDVRKLYELEKPGAMSASINIIEEWIKMQQHFVVKNFDRGYLERLIITCKGSLERTKVRLDKVCTLRTLTPSFFGDYDIVKDYEVIEGKTIYAPVRILTKDNERMYVVKQQGKEYTKQVFLSGFRVCIRQIEYLKLHDYANYYSFVCDLRDINISDLVSGLNLMDVRQIMTVMLDGYGIHINAIHMISSSKMIEMLVNLLKQVMSEKVGSRFTIQRDLQDLYKSVPKEVLPKDYGGDDELTLKEIHGKWYEAMTSKECIEYSTELNKACTDESLRAKGSFNEHYLGMPGSFRSLSVD